MAAGPIRHKVKSTTEEKFEQQVVVHQIYDTPPRQLVQSEERPKISDAYRWVMENDERTERIINNVLACLEQSKHTIVPKLLRKHQPALAY